MSVGDRVRHFRTGAVGTVTYLGSPWTADVRWDDGRLTCEVRDNLVVEP